jgi:hypothetical protein
MGDSSHQSHLPEGTRAALSARDLALINSDAEELNTEATDALKYQEPLVPERPDSQPLRPGDS